MLHFPRLSILWKGRAIHVTYLNIYIAILLYTYYRFSKLLPYQSPRELNELQEEYTMYQLLQEEEIPKDIWDEALVIEDDEKSYHRMDIIWNFLSKKKLPDGSLCFKRLSRISKLILVLPHSNAEEERLFSIVRKNKTAFRPTLDPKGTLSSILTIKFGSTGPAHKFEPSKELLKKAKSATSEYNKMHSKKH